MVHARQATEVTGTVSGGNFDRIESVARWPRKWRRTYEADSKRPAGFQLFNFFLSETMEFASDDK